MKPIILSLLVAVSLAACTNYGKKVKTGSIEVYYKDGVTEEQAKKISALFNEAVQKTNSGSSNRKSFQVSKPSDSVLLKMVVDTPTSKPLPATVMNQQQLTRFISWEGIL